ncbi:hypothetical protein V3C99_008237 [Haemonchus contortus]
MPQLYDCGNIASNQDLDSGRELARFAVMYAKVSTRKHKKWEGDGLLICYANFAVLKTDDDKDVICRSTSIKRISDLIEGKEIIMGSWEIQIQEQIAVQGSRSQPELTRTTSLKRSLQSSPLPKQIVTKVAMHDNVEDAMIHESCGAPTNTFRKKFKCPVINTHYGETPSFIINEDAVRDKDEEPVIADPLVSRHLRDHQKEGVRFIYAHLQEQGGIILADEMGLGKSIQAIVATMALLKQPKSTTGNAARKCLLVVPSSLVDNWRSEFRKWFQMGRAPVMTVRRASDITTYVCSVSTYPYLIISYEMALRYREKLATIHFDILVCDEGHRLKNVNGKLRQALDSLGVPRRLLLTGTPLQNDIEEFFSLLDFVRPNCFGTFTDFKSKCHKEDGSLNMIISDCLLRRTSEINTVHLPVRNDYVLFCAPSDMQKKLLHEICEHISGEPLVLINMMRKAANHPAILFKQLSESVNKNKCYEYSSLLTVFPHDYSSRPVRLSDSGKLSVLIEMMACFRQMGECVVIVSNFTKTLDMVTSLCSSLGLCVMRLDGKTPVADRQTLITKFNSEKNSDNVFLLSTKAGGIGLNLIGASRLILFDSDWNPASDLQAMARIWRDGQTKPCHIYRLITAGTVEEKILHRQIKKTGLNSLINLTDEPYNPTFLDDELKNIFTLSEVECETHEMAGCSCDGCGLLPDEVDDESEVSDDDDQSLINTDDSACMGEGPSENQPATDQELAPNQRDEQASWGEIFRWRHYSPRHREPWEHFKSVAGFNTTPLEDLTFAFHLSTRF